jgi:hypothetical protein
MTRLSSLAAALMAVLATGGCDLNVGNPNDLDRDRAFSDPASLEELMSGAMRTWVATRGDYYMMPLTTQADNYTGSWNNAAMRLYSSVGAECPIRCGWTNSSTAGDAGLVVEASWYGYHTVLVSANGLLLGIANGVCFDEDCSVDSTLTSRNKAVAKMLQGMALAGIALLYDKGFAVDETVDLSNPLAIPFNTRAEVRDLALQKLEQAWVEAGVATWETGDNWMGVDQGKLYTNDQIRRLIRTMQAELVALWPRNAAENAAADWAAVATYASQGISSGTPFDWEYYIDLVASLNTCETCVSLDWVKGWGNSILTMRVDNRVAALLTTNHVDPWPEPTGNPCPTVSPDRRVGDGTIGPADNTRWATTAATADAGTDFACSETPIFQAARGQYHQSNLQHIRYNRFAYNGENLPAFDGSGQDPFYTVQMNDLLWAEGLIRSNGNKVLAAEKINNSRVGRGGAGCPTPGVGGCGLLPLTGAETDAELLAALQYEQEIEFMGQGPTPFLNRRRSGYNAPAGGGRPQYVDGLVVGTPRHMPVPAKEMEVLVREIYTFGGPSDPDMAPIADGVSGTRSGVRSVAEIWREYQRMAKDAARRF